MATAMVSVLSQRPVRKDVAMTGEITLRGNVLPVGGVKEKVLAARRARVTKIILPHHNRRDMDEVPKELFGEMTVRLRRERPRGLPRGAQGEDAVSRGARPAPAAPAAGGRPESLDGS